MRHARLLLGLVAVAAVGIALSTTRIQGQPAAVAGDANHKKITVTGIGTVSIKPDTARVSFAVKGTGNDFKSAVADCDKKAAAVKKALEDLKLGGLDIKSGPINVVHLNPAFGPGMFPGGPGFPQPVPGGPGVPPGFPAVPGGAGIPVNAIGLPANFVVAAQPAPKPPPQPQPAPAIVPQPFPGGGLGQPFPGPIGPGFGANEVSRTFTVVATFGGKEGAGELKDIVPTADKILTAAVGAGATEQPVFNNSNGQFGFVPGGIGNGNTRVEFYRANVSQLRQEALKLAVADAVASAKAAAGVANLAAKDIVSISDQNQNSGPFGGVGGMPTNTGRGEVLGEMEVTVQISVTFSY